MIFFVTSLLRSCSVVFATALKEKPIPLSPLVTQSFLPTERSLLGKNA